MGGGDLNLKKSWHPSTLRNIERVWKAEQKHEAEQQKIEQLQKELAAERARDEIRLYAEDQGVVRKRDERLDWMYQGPAAMVNRDDYLLGRKIDKTFELLQMQESGMESTKEESATDSLFQPRSSSSSVPDVTVDLANKIREDPLFAIMKKEKEQRKNLLNNPVKMKQLQTMLEDALKKKHKKSKKKKKKHRHKSPSSSSSEASEETVKKVRIAHLEKNRDSHVTERMNVRDNRDHQLGKGREWKEHGRKHRTEENFDDDKKYKRRSEHDGLFVGSKKFGQYSKRYSTHENERILERKHTNSDQRVEKDMQSQKRLTAEEKERLRQEMMDNAKWRERQRENNVKRYIKEDKKEDKVRDRSASNFIRPMLSEAAEKGSVENRVKQKIFTIQRNKSDMDSRFARR